MIFDELFLMSMIFDEQFSMDMFIDEQFLMNMFTDEHFLMNGFPFRAGRPKILQLAPAKQPCAPASLFLLSRQNNITLTLI